MRAGRARGSPRAGNNVRVELLAPLVMFVVFLGLYVSVRRRGDPVQWGWLAAIVVLAAAALVVGALAR